MTLIKSFLKSTVFLTLSTIRILHESKLIFSDFLESVGALYLEIVNGRLKLVYDLILFIKLLVSFVLFFLQTVPDEFHFCLDFNQI